MSKSVKINDITLAFVVCDLVIFMTDFLPFFVFLKARAFLIPFYLFEIGFVKEIYAIFGAEKEKNRVLHKKCGATC